MEHIEQSVVNNHGVENRKDLFWLLLLVSLIPALRSNLLFPSSWFSGLSGHYAFPAIDNPFFYLSPLLGLMLILAAKGTKFRYGAFAALPYFAIFLADSAVGASFAGLNTIYAVSAFCSFVFFAYRGNALSLPFMVFSGLLIVWQFPDDQFSTRQILVFFISVITTRLAVEAVRQNLPLARELGKSNLAELSVKTFQLWWPMLILLGIGLWFSNQISKATHQLMYESEVVISHCSIDASATLSTLPCPEGGLVLHAAEFYRQPLTERQFIAIPSFFGESEQVELDKFTDEIKNSFKSSFVFSALSEQSIKALVNEFIHENYDIVTLREGRLGICRFNAALYDTSEPEPPAQSFLCPPDDGSESWALTRMDFYDSLKLTVERQYDIVEWNAYRTLDTINAASIETEEKAVASAREIFSAVPTTTGMKTRRCDSPPWLDCEGANIAIRRLNRAYINKRDDMERDFTRSVANIAGDTSKDFQEKTEAINLVLTSRINEAENKTLEFIERLRSTSDFIRQILLLWLGIIVIKSVLFVFARVIFDKSTEITVNLLDENYLPVQGEAAHLQEVNIPGTYPHDIYYKSNYQPLGPAPKFSVPQWRASLLSRLRFGSWNMSRVDMPMPDENGITFNSIEAEHLVDWTMKEGEEVIFSYRNFVAMNENIQLNTIISLRVSSVLLGRTVFHVAKCQGGLGRLILRTRGKPATASQVRQSIPAGRLIAWDRHVQYSVDSHLTLVDVFLNGFNLKKMPPKIGNAHADSAEQSQLEGSAEASEGILVVEADARDRGVLVGTLRFARNFLMPY